MPTVFCVLNNTENKSFQGIKQYDDWIKNNLLSALFICIRALLLMLSRGNKNKKIFRLPKFLFRAISVTKITIFFLGR